MEERRSELQRELNREDGLQPAAGLEARLRDVDARILALDAQVAQADQAVAQAASIPGATVEPWREQTGPSDEFIAIPVVFTLAVLMPIAVAYARRIWKRGSTIIAPVPREVTERIDQMAQAVESIAIEVERIGEGQRFLTRVMSDQPRAAGQGVGGQGAVGPGAAQPVTVPQLGEHVAVRPER